MLRLALLLCSSFVGPVRFFFFLFSPFLFIAISTSAEWRLVGERRLSARRDTSSVGYWPREFISTYLRDALRIYDSLRFSMLRTLRAAWTVVLVQDIQNTAIGTYAGRWNHLGGAVLVNKRRCITTKTLHLIDTTRKTGTNRG